MYAINRKNTEERVKGIADAWHEGSISSAATALEIDIEHISGPSENLEVLIAENHEINLEIAREKAQIENNTPDVKIQHEYFHWFGKDVIAMRGPNNSIYLYQPEKFDEIKNKINSDSKKYDTEYPNFNKNLSLGTVQCHISDDGIIFLPSDLCSHLGSQGNVYFKEFPEWLQLKKSHKNECSCEDPACAKCLHGNCRNPECSIHIKK